VEEGDSLCKKPFVTNLKDYLDWRPLPVLTVFTAFRKYEVTIFRSMTEVEFSHAEPASLCRAAGENSDLFCFSSAAETEL
jgi:hypothetical protein